MADDKRFHLDCLGDRAAFVLRVGGDSPPTASSGWRHHAEADLVYAIRLVRTAVVTSSHRCAVTSRRLSGHLLCRFLWLLYRRHSRTNGFIDADGLALSETQAPLFALTRSSAWARPPRHGPARGFKRDRVVD
jgi:hypothetical protein